MSNSYQSLLARYAEKVSPPTRGVLDFILATPAYPFGYGTEDSSLYRNKVRNLALDCVDEHELAMFLRTWLTNDWAYPFLHKRTTSALTVAIPYSEVDWLQVATILIPCLKLTFLGTYYWYYMRLYTPETSIKHRGFLFKSRHDLMENASLKETVKRGHLGYRFVSEPAIYEVQYKVDDFSNLQEAMKTLANMHYRGGYKPNNFYFGVYVPHYRGIGNRIGLEFERGV